MRPPSTIGSVKDRSPRVLKDAANRVTRAWGVATASQRPDPDFLVIGTKRGGTTSLFNYLLMHPGILGLYPQVRGLKSTDYFFKNRHRGPGWYHSHFHTTAYRRRLGRSLGHQPISGESSPYYMWDPRIAAHAHALSPGLKAVALVRDPVERAWSHYLERQVNGVEPLSFAAALEAESARTDGELDKMAQDPSYYSEAHDWYSYRARGIYQHQLENWVSVFSREQLLVVRSEDMYADPQAVFDVVSRFLEIPTAELPSRKAFNSSPRETLDPAVRAELREFYAPHNARLEAYLGRELGWS